MSAIKQKRSGPLQRRIITVTLACILLICAVVSVISFYIFRNYLKNNMINSTGIGLANLSESVNNEVNEVYRLVRYCQSNSDILEHISQPASESNSSVNKVYDRLLEEYQGNPAYNYILRAAAISDVRYVQVCQATYSTTKKLPEIIPLLPYYENVLNSHTYDYHGGIVSDPFMSGTPRPVIPIIRPIIYRYGSDQIGYVFLEFSTALITDQIQKYHMNDDDILLFIMGEHAYRYEDNQLTEIRGSALESYELADEYTSDSGIIVNEINSEKGKFTVLLSPLSNMEDCYFAHVMSPDVIRSERYAFLMLFGGVLLIVIGIGILLNIYMDRSMYQPVNLIRDKIKQTASGDFSRDPSIEWNHELGEIGRGINDLSESVNELMESRLADEKKKRDLEYQMLQSQINPHFLYNTLNSIKMMAQVQGATGISEMTTSLASLLRSISKGTSLIIPISEELSLVKDYFTIQNYRYGGMIEFRVNIEDPELQKSRIIKFTLQPLVENAIFHGLEPKGGIGTITLNLYSKDDSTICIEITDNGVGMDAEQAAKLLKENDKKSTDFFKEIGISNVNKRLQYEFGEQYGLSVESVPGEYTTMRVLLPKEETNDKSINS